MIGQPLIHSGICTMIIHAVNLKIYFSAGQSAAVIATSTEWAKK